MALISFRRFVLEVRKNDGDVYPPQSLFSLIMGIQSHIRLLDKRNLDILRNPTYEDFRQVLDGEMKRLTSLGLGHAQQAEPIEVGEENQLWKNRVLGEHNPKVLVHTLVYLNGLHFSLRSGAEHRNLRYKQSQIKLFKPSSGPAYLRYTEDVSKTFRGGLKHRKLTPKVVEHHENPCKERCHIRLYEKYLFLCPTDGHDEAFYLNPLQHPTEKCWYSRQAMGHNTLQKVVPDLCRKAGISGYKTNHSLRRTTATRLFEKGVPEQLIMERTGHRSVEGVRAYKVTSDAQRLEVSSLINRPGQEEDADVTDQKPTDTLPATRDTSPVEELFNFLPHYVELIYFLSKSGREFRKMSKYVHTFSEKIIAARKEALATDPGLLKKRHLDFLDILLTAKDETGSGLTDQEIRDEVDTFTFEGHDTTSSAISWLLYCLALYPEEQEKVLNEVLRIVGDREEITWDDLSQFQYIPKFIKETMRLYPPVPVVSRRLTQPLLIDGVEVPPGVCVDVSMYQMHRNPHVWEDCLEFNPNRFNSDNSTSRDPYTFVPFSAGPRNCIGMNFALNELKVLMCQTVKRFHIDVDPDKPAKPFPEVVLRSEGGLHLKFTPRV